jgi:hypothetical protein
VLPWGHFPLLRVDGGLEKGGQNLSNSISLQWYVCAEEAPELIPKVREHSGQRRFCLLTFPALHTRLRWTSTGLFRSH